MSQPQGPRLPAPRLHPPHAAKTDAIPHDVLGQTAKRVAKTRDGFGRERLASGIETLGEKLERRQPRKLLTRPPMEIGDARLSDPD